MKKELHLRNQTPAVVCSVIFLIFLVGCGIYVVTEAPNAPYDTAFTFTELTFYGDNEEPYFEGYNVWYRYSETEQYRLCRYQNQDAVKPTLVPEVIPVENEIFKLLISEVKPTTGDESFKELYEQNEIESVYLAVSAYGIVDGSDAESVKVPFGLWPN